MAYGFKIVDAAGNEFTDNSFTLLTLAQIVATGEKTNWSQTVNLELPPNYDITVYPFISYTPVDATVPTWNDNIYWSTLNWAVTKDTSAPTYSATFVFNIAYNVIGKQATNGCMSYAGGVAGYKANTQTTFVLVGGSEY